MRDVIVRIFAVFIFIESDSEHLLVRFSCHSYQSADLEKPYSNGNKKVSYSKEIAHQHS